MESSYQSQYLPSSFEWMGRASQNSEISLHFALKHKNMETFQSIFESVSNPLSPQYGEYLSWNEVGDLLVDPSSRQFVIQWLRDNGVDDIVVTGTGDWIVATMSVATAENLLDTSFSTIKTTQNMEVIRALSPYSLPRNIASHIDIVGGVHGFVGLTSHSVENHERISTKITPSIAKAQTFSNGVMGQSSNSSQAVAQFLEQYYNPNDLSTYQQQYDLDVQAVTKLIGENKENEPGAEATLDIELIMAMGENIDTWFVSTSGRHEKQEPFLDWIETMESTPDAPWIHSVSYGDHENSISLDYAQRCNVEFQKFGVTGRTIFFASGDDGVGCVVSGCLSGNHTLIPNWPATSPYVTSVGGIVLETSGELKGDTISSGGFSNVFPAQSWQYSAVSGYLTSSSLPNEFFNTSNRAVPDISAFSNNVQIVYKGRTGGVGGTSCASPIVAGVFALLNDLRLQNNKATLGFLNPLIYQIAAADDKAFTDITSGQNSHSCCKGFDAASGWDPITGLGLPNYSVLASYM